MTESRLGRADGCRITGGIGRRGRRGANDCCADHVTRSMAFEDWLVLFWPPDRWPMTLSDIERWRVAYNAVDRAAREECAAICDARAMKCENEITTELSQDEIVELRSLAWQFSVLAQQIRNTIKEGW